MAFLYSSKIRRFLLTLILAWGSYYFYFANQGNSLLIWLFLGLSLITFFFIWFEASAIFILIVLSFLSAYGFFISFYQFNLPLWLIMLVVLLIFAYLFTYTEQKIGILGNQRLIYLLLFSIIILEVFLIMSYYSINPISQSLVVSCFSYLFVGYCYTILAKHTDNKFLTYIILTAGAIALIFSTSTWGGLV